MKLLMILALALPSSVSFAKGGDHPCRKIIKACRDAGFQKGKHEEGKGLFKDCLGKIKNGESVPGVNVDAQDVEACKAKHQARKERREKRK